MLPRMSGPVVHRLVAVASVGAELAAAVVLGHLLDLYLDSGPWGVLGGAALGFGLAIYQLIRLGTPPDDARPDGASPPSRGGPPAGDAT